MPKGIQGFQKGHTGFLTKEHYVKIGKKTSKILKEKFKGRTLNTGKTHFKNGHGMNKGNKNPMWKGGEFTDKNGYVFILKHGHPMARPSGYILKHRFVMAEHMGRPLKRNEIVHHVNGNKSDNAISNLSIMSVSEHTILHCSKKIISYCEVCKKKIIDSPRCKRKYCSLECYRLTIKGRKNKSH